MQARGDRRTTRSSTDVFGGSVERYGLETIGVVWAYGAEDDEEEGLIGWANPNSLLVTDYNFNSVSLRRGNEEIGVLSVGRT